MPRLRALTAIAVAAAALGCSGKKAPTAAGTLCPALDAGPAGPDYLPPDAVPTGKACDATTVCMVATGTPCVEPNQQPEVTTWQCTCASGAWSCVIAYESHSICVDAGPQG
ncbi:MAG TPA: hypothetical protein VIY73_08425 [Polyangiaceae bacterium]